MSETSATKKIIASGFKEVMDKKSFEKITISDIAAQCGLNRQSFYYHFRDKYELLNWILNTDIFIPFKDGLTIDNWNDKLLATLIAIKDNSRFYTNAFNTTQGNEFRQFLFEAVTDIMSEIIDQLTADRTLMPEDKQFIAEFFSYGISGSVTKWVRSGMKQSPESTAKHIKVIVNGFKSFAAVKFLSSAEQSPWQS